MRNVFIDLGAGSGDDIKGYYSLDEGNRSHEVFAFEANPKRTAGIKKRFPEATVYTAAVGTEDGTARMYLGNTLNTSSLNEKKVSVSTNNYIDVRVMDFCNWMRSNFTENDYITVVIDIEGGEYEILAEMESQGLWDWIDHFYVEFHGEKIADFDMDIENGLVERLIDHFNDRVYIFRKHQHEQFLKLNPEGT